MWLASEGFAEGLGSRSRNGKRRFKGDEGDAASLEPGEKGDVSCITCVGDADGLVP